MLNEKLTKALSEQINAEFYSAYLYIVMSAKVNELGLKGASSWLYVQAQEEMVHGTHIYKYVLERGATPFFSAIENPPTAFDDINGIFNMVLSHEKIVTLRINAIATLAMQELDHACYQFMMWYVNEQVEEEAKASAIVDKLRLIRDNPAMLLNFDNELAARVFVDNFPVKKSK